jgi:Ser/Thr protein kinase RdoA (MazF antagonist)
MTHPLKRLSTKIDPQAFLVGIAEEFGLGGVKSYSVVEKGLVGVNFKLSTGKGTYLVKIQPGKSKERVEEIASALMSMSGKVPVPKVFTSKQGKPCFEVTTSGAPVCGYVLSWFDGTDVTSTELGESDLKELSRLLAGINNAKIKLKGEYDPWFISNLVAEYRDKSKIIADEKYKRIVKKVVRRFAGLDLAKLRDGVVHGDLSRENLLRGKAGFCVIDFDTLNLDKIAPDFAVLLSHFCLSVKNPSAKTFLKIYRIMLEEYRKHVNLSGYEVANMPLLVKATYAVYYVMGSYYYHTKGEPHAQYWIELGKRGLDLTDSIEESTLVAG